MSSVILITAIGGDISQGVATIIRECHPEYRLIGVDTHAQHGGHKFVDVFCIVPNANSVEYLTEIKSVVIQHAVNMVFPMSEPELAALRPFQDLAPHVTWLIAGNQVIEAGIDKLETMRALAMLGLPRPWTHSVGDGPPLSFPCILKNRFGSGSRGVFVIANKEDADYFSKRFPEAIYQEMLQPADREVTCAVYRTRAGEVASLLMLRRLSGGFTGWAKVIHDDETSRLSEQIAHGLDLRGSMNVQLRITDNGPRVFEINPRISSTALMRHRLGFKDVLWTLYESLGKSVIFPKISEHQIMVRVQGALVFPEQTLEARK